MYSKNTDIVYRPFVRILMRNVRFESKTTPSHWKSLRVLGVLFCLIVLTVGFAGAAGASGIDITLGTPASGDNWAYDSLNETLTLNGGTWEYINATGAGDLIIELNGTNNITGGCEVGSSLYGIYVLGNLTVQDGIEGFLNVTTAGTSKRVSGIYSSENITIQSGIVEVHANTTGMHIACGIRAGNDFSVISGTVTVTEVTSEYVAYGITAAGIIEISGGTVTVDAQATGASGRAEGIGSFSDVDIEGGTVIVNVTSINGSAESIWSEENLTISGGKVEVLANGNTDITGITAGGVTILGSEVAVIVNGNSTTGIMTFGDIIISGGKVTADVTGVGIVRGLFSPIGSTSISDSAEISIRVTGESMVCGLSAASTLTISDSAKVDVAEVTANYESSEAYGIYVDDGDLVISDSATVTVSEVTGCCSAGICVYGDFIISDTAEVKVTAVNSTDDSAYGIYTDDNLLISDSAKVNVADVTAYSESEIPSHVYAYGIIVYDGYLTISDTTEITVTEVTGLSASGIDVEGAIEISGGTVTVDVQATAAECLTQGIISYSDVVISSGAVTVNAISLNGPAYGLSSYMDDIFISGGSVTVNTEATGNDASGIYTSSYSMDDGVEDTGDIFISGGEVTVNAKAGGESEYVISAYSIQSQRGVIEISGGVVTANAKATEEADAYGLSAESEITISDGSVTVYADAAGDYAYGIYVDSGGVFAQTNGVVNTRAKVTGDLGYAYGVGDHKSEITGGKITAIGDNWAFAASYSSDRLIVASTLTVRASENIEGTGLSEVSPSVVTEVGSEYKYVVIEYLQKDDTPSGNSGSSSKPSKPSKPVEPEIPEEPSEPGIITPSETIVEDTKEIIVSDETTEVLETGETVTVVELEDTEIIQSVAVPEEIAEENPGASVMVTEGNKDTVLLPGDITTEDVHVIVDLAVVDTEGKPVKIKSSGYFILDANVPNGKKLAVGHYKDGIWEDCKVEHIGNGQYKVHYNSLSPFAAVFIEEDEESPFVVAEEPVDEPEIPENPESSMPILAVLAGLGVVVLIRRK